MKRLTLNKRILFVLFSSIGFTIVFAFFFIHYLYSELYLSSIEESIVYQGKRTASHYHYGELSDEIIQKIQWYNIVSENEIIVVDQLEELTTYFPYQINFENLVDEADQAILEQGDYIIKEGYVAELEREILGAIFPIKGESGLIGFIYIYVPLSNIQDVFKDSIPILVIGGTLFFIILYIVVNRIWKSLFKPLKNLQQFAMEVSKGDYSNQLYIERDDEIGQLTRAFNDMTQSLAEQETRKKEFTSNVVHELRTPLTYISGYTAALQQKIYTSPSEAENYLQTIAKETERLNKLINDLIELDYLEEGLYTIEKEPIVLAQLLFETIELFDIHIKEKGITVELDINEDVIILGDMQRIQQVFYNTIDNAIKYADEDGRLEIKLQKDEAFVQYIVINDGDIIDATDIDHIGERFYRSDKARNRTTGGTGLGLSIVKQIVQLHDGTFSIMSYPEKGTVVTIQFYLLNESDGE